MKNAVKMFIIPFIVMLASDVYCQSKLDPYLRLDPNMVNSFAKVSPPRSDDGFKSIIIKADFVEDVRQFIERGGGEVHSSIGNIMTADVPMALVGELSEHPEIVYVEAAKPLRGSLDRSRVYIGLDDPYDYNGDEQQYTGKGVIIGIIDSGIDYTHEVFFDEAGNSRILSIWDQTVESSDDFLAPSEIENSYGIECMSGDIGDGSCPSIDDVGHGTHVAGIAAGSHHKYSGVAPGAELIIVKAERKSEDEEYTTHPVYYEAFSSRVIDAVSYIFEKAENLGRPAVINISMGTHYGAHDGRSLFEEALNELLAESAGRSIVASAGNTVEHSNTYIAGVHAGAEINFVEQVFEFHGFEPHNHALVLDIWQAGDSDLSFGIGVDDYENYEETGSIASGEGAAFITEDGNIEVYIDSTETENPLNGKKHTIVYIVAAEGDDGVEITSSNYVFDLFVSGNGSFDAWIVGGGGLFVRRTGGLNFNNHYYLAGNRKRSISIPATARDIISVVSFASRDDFLYFEAPLVWNVYDFTPTGSISTFSNVGPTPDPESTGQKPEIAAPGEWIFSALSSNARADIAETYLPMDESENFFAAAGTSMAAPHVAGAIAHILERDPDLTSSDIKMLLLRNASAVGSLPNNAWGFGKLDLTAVMENFEETEVAEPLSFATVEVDEPTFEMGVNANENVRSDSSSSGTGGGCSLSPGSETAGFALTGLYLFFLSTALLVILRLASFRRVRAIFLFALLLLCSCGGGSGGAPGLALNFADNTMDLGVERLDADIERGSVTYFTYDDEGHNIVAISMMQNRFEQGGSVALGADNLYTLNKDQAIMLVRRYKYDAITIEKEYWVSVSGDLVIQDSVITIDRRLKANLKNVKLRIVNPNTMLIDRNGGVATLSRTIDLKADEGVVGKNLIGGDADVILDGMKGKFGSIY